MDLAPDDDLGAVVDLARKIALDVLAPIAREAERAQAVPPTAWATLAASGLAGAVPEELGGGGVLDPIARQKVVEQLAHGDAGIAMAAVWNGAAAGLIAAHGSPEQRAAVQHFADDVEHRGGVAIYEGFGRGLSELTTSVTCDGDTVRVVGTKVAVPFASVANPLVVVGRDLGSGSLRAVVTASSADGVTVTPGKPGLALDAAGLASISFDLTVPVSDLLGGTDLDADQLGASLQQLRLLVASAMVGTAQRSIEYAAAYVSEREAFGRPIASFQGVSFPMAESLMRLQAARLEVTDLVSSIHDVSAEALDRAVGNAIAYASAAAVDATRHGVQSLGGHGFVEDHPVELWHRSTTALAALDNDPLAAPFQAAL